MNKVNINFSNNDEKEWELLLEEYNSLRSEALEKMERQYRIISLGVGGVGTLLAIAFQLQVYPLFLVLPLAIIASMILYDSERDAIMNIGEYVFNLEQEFLANSKVKGWETWLREGAKKGEFEKRKPYRHFDYASLTILFTLLIGCIIGIFSFSGEVKGFEILNSSLFRIIIALIYFLVGLCLFISLCREAR